MLSEQRQRMKARAEQREAAKAAPRDYRKLTPAEKRIAELETRARHARAWEKVWRPGSEAALAESRLAEACEREIEQLKVNA